MYITKCENIIHYITIETGLRGEYANEGPKRPGNEAGLEGKYNLN